MVRLPSWNGASARTQWLFEVYEALDEAQQLLLRLGPTSGDSHRLIDLHLRIGAARLEARSLQLRRPMSSEDLSSPEWSEFHPWQRRDGA